MSYQRETESDAQLYALPLTKDARADMNLLLTNRPTTTTLEAQTQGSPVSILGQSWTTKSDASDQPRKSLWDWQFGSRMLARYGTVQARELGEQSPMVKAVLQWRENQKQYKAKRRLRSGM